MIAFDQDFGFEYTLLEPTDFWRRVPPKLRSIYHFYNAPVSHRHTDTELSIVDMIMDVATPEDFVAFKLDIDTPEVRRCLVSWLLVVDRLWHCALTLLFQRLL